MNPEKIDVYRIDGVLGEGGMGRVYRAWDEELERAVAIKVVRSETAAEGPSRERFRREARVVAGLDHPGVVRIHRLLEWQGHDAIVMELVEGQTLGHQIRSHGPSIPRALILGREIAEGLAAAHRQGVVHRDLKTSNIMVTRYGRAKILDFGLAKQLAEDGDATLAESVTSPGAILGTFHTMAPEQALGQTVDSRADLFSFGVVLYEMLGGRSPFRGKTPKETLARVLSARHPPLTELDPEIPDGLSSLVDQLLAKNPADRPSSASEVVDRLRRMAVDLGYDSGVETDDLSARSRDEPKDRETTPEPSGPATARSATAGSATAGSATSEPGAPSADTGVALGAESAPQRGVWRWLAAGLLAAVLAGLFLLRPSPEAAAMEQARQNWVAFDPVQTLEDLRTVAWKQGGDPEDPRSDQDVPEILSEGHPEALLLAAEAWMELGQKARAQQAIDVARSVGLSADQRRLADGLEAEKGSDYASATQHFQELRDRSPKDPAATIRLVRVALRLPGSELSELVDNTVQDYLRLDSDGPLGWYLKAKAADVGGHFRIARDAATEAAERSRGGRLEARALLVLGLAQRAGGEIEAGNETLLRAEELFRWVGDSRGEAQVSEMLAFGTTDILAETARRHLQTALEIHTRNEDLLGQARVLGHLCTQAGREGDFDAVDAYCSRAAESFRALDALHELVAPLNELGATKLLQKEITAAALLFDEVRDLAHEVGHREALTILEINLGEMYFAQGRFDEAWNALAGAKAEIEGDPVLEGYLDAWLGQVASVSNRTSAAETERLFEDAVELQTVHEPGSLPDTLLAWATAVSRRLGTSDPEGVRRLDERLARLDREVVETGALAAQNLRAVRLWWTGNPTEAAAVLEPPAEDDRTFEALRTRGLALALGGEDPTPILESLDHLASDARQRGSVVETLEVGLAAAEIAVLADQPEAGPRLRAVLDGTAAIGAEGLARWARTLLARTHR